MSKRKNPNRRRSRSPTGLSPIRIASPANSISNQRIQRKILTLAAVPCLVLAILLIWQLADANKGYCVRQIEADTYQIDVVVDRALAGRLLKYMYKNQITSCELKDVRLPGGIMATARLNYNETLAFLQGSAQKMVATTIWRLSEHSGTHADTEQNMLTVYIEYSRTELYEALRIAQTEPTDKHMMTTAINLPTGYTGCCSLTAKELDNYVRRMHVVGAQKISIPFYWSLDGKAIAFPLQRIL